MSSALLKLMYVRSRAAVRKLMRGARRPRGLLYLLIGGFVLTSWLCGGVMGTFFGVPRPAVQASWFPVVVPLFLLAHTVSSLLQYSAGTIIFTPAEIDFLFPGPFTRRELLLYKLSGKFAGCFVGAGFLCLAFYRLSPNLPALYFGLALSLIFLQLVQTAAALASLALTQGAWNWGRVVFLTLLVLLLAGAVAQFPAVPRAIDEFPAWWTSVSTSLPGRILLGPFQVFSHAILAQGGLGKTLLWMALAGGIDLALFVVVLGLDANFLESSLTASQRRYERIERARQGKKIAAIRPPKRMGRVPLLGWWGGIGPMAWRQGTTALRTGRTMLILGPVLFGIALLLGIYNERVALGVVNTVLIYLTLILLAQLRYDFRGDIDNIPWLKTLPVGAVGLAAGQLVIPVVIAALTLLSALAGLWAAIPSARLPLTAAMAFVPVVVLLLFGVENAFFLIFPSRSFVLNVGELQSMGRFVVVFSCKALVLGVSAGLALALGGLAWLAAGHSLVAAGVAAWLVVGAAACGTVPVVAWAFRRFDPGADIPA